MKTRQQMNDSFSKEEIRKIATAKRITRKMEFPIRHMAERCAEVKSSKKKLIFLFYLPDFTMLFKDWYRKYIEFIFKAYPIKAAAKITAGKEFLILKYTGQRPKDFVRSALCKNDFRYLYSLLDRARKAEEECRNALDNFENDIPKLAGIPKELIEKMSYYASFALNNVFPEEFFMKTFPTVDLARLFYSPISSWEMLYEKASHLLEKIYTGEEDEEKILEGYAREVSYLRWGDICPHSEDVEYSKKIFAGMKMAYPNFSILWNHNQEEEFNSRLSALTYGSYIRKARTGISKSKKKIFEFMVVFAREAQRYNEMRRILFTKSLRLFRKFCEQKNINWKTISLNSLLTQERRWGKC